MVCQVSSTLNIFSALSSGGMVALGRPKGVLTLPLSADVASALYSLTLATTRDIIDEDIRVEQSDNHFLRFRFSSPFAPSALLRPVDQLPRKMQRNRIQARLARRVHGVHEYIVLCLESIQTVALGPVKHLAGVSDAADLGGEVCDDGRASGRRGVRSEEMRVKEGNGDEDRTIGVSEESFYKGRQRQQE